MQAAAEERREERKRQIEEGIYPTHSNYRCITRRINSFVKYDWSPQTAQSIHELAKAGFFYTGYGDATLCFQCGCGLKSWVKEDNPYVEHARTNPRCHYLKETMGEDFIRDVQRLVKKPGGANALLNAAQKLTGTVPEVPDKEILEGRECLICTSEERQIAFQPCGHFATCINCSFKINICCICRIKITSRMRIITS